MEKQAPITATCTCLHAGMWHKPDCRIRDCDCEKFERSVIRAGESVDASWVQRGRLTKGRGKGPTE